jgi:hypothetical protein
MKRVRCYSLLTCMTLAPLTLVAQVGHAPGDSPFREIRTSTTFEAFTGVIAGNGGSIPVGPRDGRLVGIRALLRARNTVSLGFSLWGAAAERTPIDPTSTVAERFLTPVDQDLFGAELTLQFNLTGGKTWHGLAPFMGIGIGLVKGDMFSTVEDDPFGYEFGSKFFFAPMLGTRVFLKEKAYLRLEARGFSWKVKYPASYVLEPADEPGTDEAPNAVNPTASAGQYVLAPSLQIGFGFAF